MKRTFYFLLALLVSSSAVSFAGEARPILTLMTHDSFAASQAVLDAFEDRNKVKLRILKSGDAGAALNQAILSKNNPLADLFFGVDNTFLSRALKAQIFVAYTSPMLAQIPKALQLDPGNRLLPVDFGDVCLNYDKKWFQTQGLDPPRGLDDLIKPSYVGLTVVQNPATSSPGLAFLLATIDHFGETGYLDFWKAMRENDVYVAAGWSEAYYGQFSRAKGGTRPIVVSYATSPAAEVFYSEKKMDQAPTAAVLTEGSVFRQIEFVGILKGTRQMELARRLVDFLLGLEFQRDIPLNMWVFPANPATPLPEIFATYSRKAQQPTGLSPQKIEADREQWIEDWTTTVLR